MFFASPVKLVKVHLRGIRSRPSICNIEVIPYITIKVDHVRETEHRRCSSYNELKIVHIVQTDIVN